MRKFSVGLLCNIKVILSIITLCEYILFGCPNWLSYCVSGSTSSPHLEPLPYFETEVWSWGKNSKGQLGLGDTIDR